MRSFIFTFIFYLWILVAMICCLPAMFFYPVIYRLNSLWTRSVMWMFKKIVGCDYRIEGLKNLPAQGGFVIASKHQSAWETFIPFTFLPKVVFVYKKELGYIPFYGWYNIAYRNVKVDRGGGAKAIRSVVEGARKRVAAGHQVIIFPQGTRTPFGVENKYRSSIYAIYKEGIPVYPAALNSGNHWPKHGSKKSGTIVWKFLPQIEPGLSKDEFMSRLAATIEIESNALNDADHKHGRGCGCH